MLVFVGSAARQTGVGLRPPWRDRSPFLVRVGGGREWLLLLVPVSSPFGSLKAVRVLGEASLSVDFRVWGALWRSVPCNGLVGEWHEGA